MSASVQPRPAAAPAVSRLTFRNPAFRVPESFAEAFCLVLVEARLNGRPSWLMADVGLRRTSIFEAVRGRFALEVGEREAVSVGIGGDNRVVGRPTRIRSLEVGDFRLAGVAARVLVDNACYRIVRDHSDCHLDGVLGLDVLARFRVHIDYPRRLLTLAHGAAGPPPDPRSSMGFEASFPYVVLEGELRETGAACSVFVDTGSPLTMVSTSFAEGLPGGLRSRATGTVPFFIAGGGRLSGVPVLPSLPLRLGSRPVDLGPVGVIDLGPLGRGLGRRIDVLLGGDVLRSHRIDMDFPRRRFSLEPIHGEPAPPIREPEAVE